MKKIKTYEISIIDKTYSKTISDETKFYTSDTALELVFKLKETEYTFESAEIVLLNVDDRSLVTRPVTKVLDSFAYELEDDIIAHYGEWRGQLRFEQAGEIYVSSPVKFRIENDLGNERPPQLSDVQSWVSLKRYADSLVEELKQAVLSVEGMDDTFNVNELERQATFETNEQERQSAEAIRVDNENKRVLNYENMQETIDSIGKVKLVNDIDVSITANGEREITKVPELTQKDDKIINYLKNDIIVGDKYYISIEVKTKGIGGRMFFYSAGGGGGNYVSLVTSDEYNLASKIVTGASNFVLVRIANITGQAQATGLVYRNVYTINLTKTFGAGNEPSKEVMDWIISGNEYFDELLINRDDLQQYEINQLRKAVIALGGTI